MWDLLYYLVVGLWGFLLGYLMLGRSGYLMRPRRGESYSQAKKRIEGEWIDPRLSSADTCQPPTDPSPDDQVIGPRIAAIEYTCGTAACGHYTPQQAAILEAFDILLLAHLYATNGYTEPTHAQMAEAILLTEQRANALIDRCRGNRSPRQFLESPDQRVQIVTAAILEATEMLHDAGLVPGTGVEK